MIAEVGYLLGRAGGVRVESALLRSTATGVVTVVDPTVDDYARAADLVDTYADFPSERRTQSSSPSPSVCTSPRSRPSTTATSGQSDPDMSTPSRCCHEPPRVERQQREAVGGQDRGQRSTGVGPAVQHQRGRPQLNEVDLLEGGNDLNQVVTEQTE